MRLHGLGGGRWYACVSERRLRPAAATRALGFRRRFERPGCGRRRRCGGGPCAPRSPNRILRAFGAVIPPPGAENGVRDALMRK
eukprot:359210-Chlamydomonas_euryale.AAC.4